MNGEHPSSEHLQRSHDGELTSAEAAAVHSHVAGCAQCQSDLDSLTRMSEFVRATVQADAAQPADAEFARLFENIERAISAPVITLPKPAPKKSRFLQRAAPALGAVALAAAAMLMVYRQDTPNPSRDTDDDGYEAATSNGDSPGRSEVVDVDFGPNAGTVFDISLADGSSIPVVWINDDDDDDEE